MTDRLRLKLAASSAIAILMTGTAHAQDASRQSIAPAPAPAAADTPKSDTQAGNKPALDDIVVTADRQDCLVQGTPTTVKFSLSTKF